MFENEKTAEKAVLVGVCTGRGAEDTTEESMKELSDLAETAGAEVAGTVLQSRPAVEAATYVGEGKLEEIKNACATLGADLLIFDDELTGSQIRNIEEATGVRVIDRTMLILDIFAKRALSKEGKLQVELAQLKYRLARLSGIGASLSRLGGGIGTRGPGEAKLETDRRHIRRRIDALEEELKKVERHRELIRGRRRKDKILTVALVGYTNAGKSTLMNALTDAGVLAEDKLFATLDPTARALRLSDNRNAVLIDTVGFIRKLPHHLIEAFKSTLEEATLADVLLHVIDASSPEMGTQIRAVEDLLDELGCAGKPVVAVFNKCDLCPEFFPRPAGKYTDYVTISAKYGRGLGELAKKVEEYLPGRKHRFKVLVPYGEGGLVAAIHESELVLSEEYTPQGTLLEILADEAVCRKLKGYAADGEL